MLEPGKIPEKEPDLRVGIILPEDQQKSITIELPAKPEYLLVDPEKNLNKLSPGNQIKFYFDNDTIEVESGNQMLQAHNWTILPVSEDYKMKKEAGVCVKNVISGRSFHWKKHIDVFLPGKIEISIVDKNLILVNELPIEQYLMCVATSEMGSACPSQLIESQTIVARSWMLANVEQKHRHLGFDVCNDDCCQRYQGSNNLSRQSITGALETAGQVLMYHDQICDARYSKSCGGIMESFEKVWEGGPLPYMKPIPDAKSNIDELTLPLDNEEKVRKWIESIPPTFCSPQIVPEEDLKKYLGSVDEEGHYFRWEFEYSQKELTDLLNEKCQLQAQKIKKIEPVARGFSGRLTKVRVRFLRDNGEESQLIEDQYHIRECFHESFLYSSAFVVDEIGNNEIPAKFILKGAGWGHGVGYCQIGALGMAMEGHTVENIVYHYFPGAKLNKIY